MQDLQSNQLVLITGSPGIGKTGLAIEVAYQLKKKSASAIINFIDLRSIHCVDTIISKILLCFSKTAENQPVEILQNLLNSIQEEVFLILDNTEDVLTEQLKEKFLHLVKELLLKSTNLKLICTSRVKFLLMGINCKEEILNALENENAISVIHNIVPNLLSEDANKLITVCGSAPLPLWIVSNLIKDGGYSPEDIIKEISLNAEKPISSYYLEYLPENCQLEACIDSSYSRLSSELQNAFCCLSIFPSTFSIDAAKVVLSVPNVERNLASLKVRSLLCYDEASNLCSLHPYIRAFGKSRKEYDSKTTKLRFENHYVKVLLALTNTFFSRDFMAAIDQIQRDNANITEMLSLIVKDNELYETYKLASLSVSRFIYMFITVECYVSFYTDLLEVATDKKDTKTQALANFCLGYHYRCIKQDEKAVDTFMISVSQYGRWGPDKFFVPTCHSYIAWCYALMHNKPEATKHVKKSKKFLSQRKTEDKSLSMAIFLNVTGNALDGLACCQESIEIGLQSLKILEDLLGNHLETARHLHNLGIRYSDLAKFKDGKQEQRPSFEEALKYSVRAGKVYENVIGNKEETANSMFFSGLMNFNLQNFKESSVFFKKSLEIREVLYGPGSESVMKAKHIQQMADNKVAAEKMRVKMAATQMYLKLSNQE